MLRIFLPGLFALAIVPMLAAEEYGPANYQPDYFTRDIYLPHVQRTYPPPWWKMKLLPNTQENPATDAGTLAKYYIPEFDDSDWTDQVIAHPWNSALGQSPRYAKNNEFEGVGWYRVKFRAPANPANLRAIMYFENINTEATVYLNGEKAGFNKGAGQYFFDFELDLTDRLRFGQENSLAIRVYSDRNSVPSNEGGITGRVYLDLRPSVSCRHILVTPEDGLCGLRYDCVLDTSEPGKLDGWQVEVFEWNSGKIAATAGAGEVRRANGETFLTGSVAVPDAKPWSCESPFLYGIRFRDAKGQLSGIQRFGMRTFKVVDGQFKLNGKPTFLRGWVQEAHRYDAIAWKRYMFMFNERNGLYRFFKQAREANINHIRFHSSFLRQPGYDILDELGILVCDELNYPSTPIENPESGVEIRVYGHDGACDKQGALRPSFVEQITGRVYRHYSHPCIGTFSFGNEQRSYSDPEGMRTRALFNNLYDLYKKLDLQDRPITPSSGHFFSNGDWNGGGLKREGDKLDYIDTHDYTGSGVPEPLWDCTRIIDSFIATAKKLWPEGIPPIVNGECGANWDNYYREYDPIWESADATEANCEALKEALAVKGHSIGLNHTMLFGSKAYKYQRAKNRGWYIERVVEQWRKRWPEADGYEFMTGPFFQDNITFPVENNTFEPNAAYEPIKQVCAPVVIVLDYPPPNRYVGDVVKLHMVVVNNDERDHDRLKAELSLRDGDQTVWSKIVPVGALNVGAKFVQDLEMTIPQVPEAARLVFEYDVRDDTELLCRRLLDFNVRSRGSVFAPLRGSRTVKVYEPKPGGAARLLRAFGIPFRTVSGFDSLRSEDLLVIGPGCMDGPVIKATEQIRSVVKAGGRVLMLSQTSPSPKLGKGKDVPLNPGAEVLNSVYAHFSEMLRLKHPFLRGMCQNELRCWNHPTYAIYNDIVTPLSGDTVLLGGNLVGWQGPSAFGNVLAEIRLGKGKILFCQAVIDRCFRTRLRRRSISPEYPGDVY